MFVIKNILSLYDGMGCAYLAMLSAGLEIKEYNAFEIDKYAVKTSQHNFPKIKHHGDVTTADFTQFKDVDYLMGGSPCTYWSIAQSPDKRETIASGIGWELFSHYVRALKECKPKHFIYENNKSMSDSIKQSISDAFGFEPICINSALVSAQNRQRLYWCGIRNEDGTYSKVEIEQPQDKGILLRDILENNCQAWMDKAYTLSSSYYKGEGTDVPRAFGGVSQCGDRVMATEPINTTSGGKSQTLKAQYPKNNESNFCCYTSTYGASGVAEPIENTGINRLGGLYGQVTRWGIYDSQGKAPTLVASAGMGGGHLPLIPFETTNKTSNTNKPIYEVKDGQITIKEKQYPIKLKDGYYIIRKLTVNECKHLQTVPDWYEFPVSDSQAYKMLGNGWTIDVIAHLIKACERGEKAPKQLSFF